MSGDILYNWRCVNNQKSGSYGSAPPICIMVIIVGVVVAFDREGFFICFFAT